VRFITLLCELRSPIRTFYYYRNFRFQASKVQWHELIDEENHFLDLAKLYDTLRIEERSFAMKMPDTDIDTNMFTPCGMNCMVCYKHCYHKKPCAGCLNHEQNKPEHCRKCKIKDCVRERGISYCYECGKYPCLQIKNLERSYRQRYQTSLLSNSEFVRINGLSAFMAWQKQLYSCPKCGGIISIHDKECSECQKKLKMEETLG